jgi:L-ribulose-5-phosphate 3-epimerase
MMNQYFPTSAVTDEFSQDIEVAARSMAELGMTGAELRTVFGKNIMDLTEAELDRAIQTVRSYGLEVVSIASPVLKCVLPDAPELDSRFQQDTFGSQHTFEDQPELTERAFAIATRAKARIIRVFSYWRTVRPEECVSRVATALRNIAERASGHGLLIGLENEHACNVATAAESAHLLQIVDHPNFRLIWDPANAYVAGENPFPGGYNLLPVERIVHVHAKDCKMHGHEPEWTALGEGGIDWTGQIRALVDDGYRGHISLETHWTAPNGDKLLGSIISGRNLKAMVTPGSATDSAPVSSASKGSGAS